MEFVFEVTARDVPYVVGRAVNVNRLVRPPPWLVAARRVPPCPSLVSRPREWDNVAAKFDWEAKDEAPTETEQAAYETSKQARQAVAPDPTAAGWTTAYQAAFAVRPHSLFEKKKLKKMEKRYRERVPHIRYPEDGLRCQFYANHPFETIRPTTMVEEDGLNKHDWSRLDGGTDSPLTAEDVIKHQHYLMEVDKVPLLAAYNQVISTFYKARAREEVARRVAEEQAVHHGAITNPDNYNTIDTALEKEENAIQKSYERMDKIMQIQKMRRMASERSFAEEDMVTAANASAV